MAGWSSLGLALGAVLAMTTLVWLASLALRGDLVVALATLWGLRLALHILGRKRGQGEDYRYRAMRERNPRTFPARSLLTVFWLQGVLLWAISAPLFQAQRGEGPAGLGPLDGLGLALFALGFVFEAGGDWQLARFKRDLANAGRVMDRGLWRYTRHSPVVMTVLLMRVSGVTLLERKLRETKPAYRRYAEETSAFFPWPPRRREGTDG